MFTKNTEVSQECLKDVFCDVNFVNNPENASDLKKNHVPVITAPERAKKNEGFEVRIEVGKLLKHPNENGYFIQFIELYADDTFLTRIDFTAKTTSPIMPACVAPEHSYKN